MCAALRCPDKYLNRGPQGTIAGLVFKFTVVMDGWKDRPRTLEDGFAVLVGPAVGSGPLSDCQHAQKQFRIVILFCRQSRMWTRVRSVCPGITSGSRLSAPKSA